MQVLERLGLSDAVMQQGIPLERIEIYDKQDGLLFRLNLHPIQAKYHYTTVSIHRAALRQSLLDYVPSTRVHLGKHCTSFTQTQAGVTVQFEDETQVEGEVLVAADGLHSIIRQSLAPGIALRYSGQTCYRGIAAMELPPALARTGQEVWGGASRFGFSAIGSREIYWFAPLNAPAGSTEPAGMLVERLAERYADFPDPIPALIECTPSDSIIRTDLYDIPTVERWWQGRAVMLGDAAHAMTPNLGQGGAQAIEDAFVLANALSSQQSLSEAFREYERRRIRRVRRVAHTAWRFGQIAHLQSQWARWLRNWTIKTVPDQMNQKPIEWLYDISNGT
jgi:2-polyprenyl-6-methoxyphenol hydroxylase-like FAD-dependent oxidoreductase